MKVIDKFLTKADGLEGYSMCCKMVSRNVEILKVESKNDELEYCTSTAVPFVLFVVLRILRLKVSTFSSHLRVFIGGHVCRRDPGIERKTSQHILNYFSFFPFV